MEYTRRVWTFTRSSQAASSPARHRSINWVSASKKVPGFGLDTVRVPIVLICPTVASAAMVSSFHYPEYYVPAMRTKNSHDKFDLHSSPVLTIRSKFPVFDTW